MARGTLLLQSRVAVALLPLLVVQTLTLAEGTTITSPATKADIGDTATVSYSFCRRRVKLTKSKRWHLLTIIFCSSNAMLVASPKAPKHKTFLPGGEAGEHF